MSKIEQIADRVAAFESGVPDMSDDDWKALEQSHREKSLRWEKEKAELRRQRQQEWDEEDRELRDRERRIRQRRFDPVKELESMREFDIRHGLASEIVKIAKSLLADTVYRTMDDLFKAYNALFAYFRDDLVGVKASDGSYHWYQHQHTKGGYIQIDTTTGYGKAKERRTSISSVWILDGMNRRQAAKKVNEILSRHTKGFFTDDSWVPVNAIWKDLTQEGIDWTLEKTHYDNDPHTRVPISKTWQFKVDFQNERGRPMTMYGVVVASGCASVESPLDKYDLVAYIS